MLEKIKISKQKHKVSYPKRSRPDGCMTMLVHLLRLQPNTAKPRIPKSSFSVKESSDQSPPFSKTEKKQLQIPLQQRQLPQGKQELNSTKKGNQKQVFIFRFFRGLYMQFSMTAWSIRKDIHQKIIYIRNVPISDISDLVTPRRTDPEIAIYRIYCQHC